MTYQNTTGTLNPGAHPGSYNGQDAYNDMLITGGKHEQDAFLLRGGAKRPRRLTQVITKAPEREMERSARFWRLNQHL